MYLIVFSLKQNLFCGIMTDKMNFERQGTAVGAAALRLHGLCAERKALWRESDTVPEAGIIK